MSYPGIMRGKKAPNQNFWYFLIKRAIKNYLVRQQHDSSLEKIISKVICNRRRITLWKAFFVDLGFLSHEIHDRFTGQQGKGRTRTRNLWFECKSLTTQLRAIWRLFVFFLSYIFPYGFINFKNDKLQYFRKFKT